MHDAGLVGIECLIWGMVTQMLLGVARDGADDRALARTICRACVDGLDVDGASISVLTATDARETLSATDDTAVLLEELQFTLNEGPCLEALPELYEPVLTTSETGC